MVSRFLANPSPHIQLMGPPGDERCGVTPVSRARSTGDSWGGGSTSPGTLTCPMTQRRVHGCDTWEPHRPFLSEVSFLTWHARGKGIRRVPTAHGAMAWRATPEPVVTSPEGRGGQVTDATAGTADPS